MNSSTCQWELKGECLDLSRINRQGSALCCLLLADEGQGRFPAVPKVLHGGEGTWRRGRLPVARSRAWTRWVEVDGLFWRLNVVRYPVLAPGTFWWTVLALFFKEGTLPLYLSFSQVLQLSMDVFPLRGCAPFLSQLQPTRSRAIYFSGCVLNRSFWTFAHSLDALTTFPAS